MMISATEASRLFNLSVALILFAVVAACGLSFRLKRELVINAAQRSASVDLSTGNPADGLVRLAMAAAWNQDKLVE